MMVVEDKRLQRGLTMPGDEGGFFFRLQVRFLFVFTLFLRY